MDNKEMDTRSRHPSSHNDSRPSIYRPNYDRRQQDSWTEFKGRIFRMASTVVLPRSRRCSTRSVVEDSEKLKAPSVRSLPSFKPEDSEESKKSAKIMRSISAQNEPRFQDDSSPMPSRRVLFAPKTFPIEEVEEEVDPSTTSPSSSRSGTPDSLPGIYDESVESLSFKRKISLRSVPSKARRTANMHAAVATNRASNIIHSAAIHTPTQTEDLLESDTLPSSRLSEGFVMSSSRSIKAHQGLSFEKDDMMDEEESEYRIFEEDDDSLVYNDFYNCMPPPVFMLSITVAEIACFIYHAKRLVKDPNYGYIGKFSPAPLESVLIYDPTRRFEVWRYFTYALVHSGYMHLVNNIVVQLVLGILLELVHKWWRVLAIYFAGILAGSLATSISEPFNFLAGASAGVYALIAAHVSTVILNWTEMERPWIRVLVFLAFVLHDCGTAVYYGYVIGEKTNVGYAAHLGGAVAGLLVGIHVLKNLQWKKWEEVLWWFCIVVCALLLLFAIAWNIFRTDLFP